MLHLSPAVASPWTSAAAAMPKFMSFFTLLLALQLLPPHAVLHLASQSSLHDFMLPGKTCGKDPPEL